MIDLLAFVLMLSSGIVFISAFLEPKKEPPKTTELDHYLLHSLRSNVSQLSKAGRTELCTLIKTLEQSDQAKNGNEF